MTHDHSHHGHDHHHHHSVSAENLNKAFYIGIGLNLAFTIIEYVMGYIYGSLALLSDASHNLSDVASLVISLIGMRLASALAKKSFTYGYKKASLLASLVNAILLIVVVIGIVKESLERLLAPTELGGMAIVIVAGIGVFINTISAFLFFKGQKDDINIKGAFLHLLVDALVSVGVVISGLVIYYTDWFIIDPVISLAIAAVILISTWGLLKESIRLVMDAVPKEINTEKITESILSVDGVKDVHHLHIWALSSTENALTAHIILENCDMENWDKIRDEIKHELEHHKVSHATLEPEADNIECKQSGCCG